MGAFCFMTEKDSGDLQKEQEFSSDRLAVYSRMAFMTINAILQNPAIQIDEFRFKKGGRNYLVSFIAPNNDQDGVFVSAGNGEYVRVQVAKSQEGTNLIEYVKHERETVSIRNSFPALDKVFDVFSQMTA